MAVTTAQRGKQVVSARCSQVRLANTTIKRTKRHHMISSIIIIEEAKYASQWNDEVDVVERSSGT